MASAESLKVAHNINGKVMGVNDRVRDVGGKVEDVQDDVQDVGNRVINIDGRVQDVQVSVQDASNTIQNVDGRVQDVQGDVQDIGNKVQDVDNGIQGIGSDVNDISRDVREANRSSPLQPILVVLSAQKMGQGISSGIVFYDGFRHQIHPSIITLPPKLITVVQQNGFFEETYLMNGNPLVHSCGYMESVCHS
jgi:uncharacterized protein YoxC